MRIPLPSLVIGFKMDKCSILVTKTWKEVKSFLTPKKETQKETLPLFLGTSGSTTDPVGLLQGTRH